MASFRGYPCCSCLAKWLPAYEKELLRRGVIRFNLDVFQLIGGAKASAGTHSQGGAFDIAQFSDEALWVARQMGADADWHRSRAQGFMPHAHGVLRGCPHNGPARYQIDAVDRGYNGLGWKGLGGRDDGPRPLSGRTWKQGIAWAKKQAKPRVFRLGLWNVNLIKPLPTKVLNDRLRRIRRRVKQFRFDVLGVVEAPSSGQGAHLHRTLIGRNGKPMKRVGSHARYIYHSTAATDVVWKSITVDGKRATLAALTIHGRRRGFILCHAVSGSTKSVQNQRATYAESTWDQGIAWLGSQGAAKADVIYLGDHNGTSAAVAGVSRGFIRARRVADWKSRWTRTYQAFGKKSKSKPGGQFDYVLIHGSKRKTVKRYRNVQTPKASDHNLVVVRIKE